MAIVGAGVVAAVVLPFSSASPSQTERSFQTYVGPGDWSEQALPAAAAGNAHVEFTWNASHATEVDWYVAWPCGGGKGWCIEGGPLAQWTGRTTGTWNTSGAPASGYCVMIVDSGSQSVNFTGQFIESYSSDPGRHLPMVPLALVISGGSMLVGMGGLALYLGAFLPSGIYDQGPADEYAPPDEPDEP
jgi:hypothetical protein